MTDSAKNAVKSAKEFIKELYHDRKVRDLRLEEVYDADTPVRHNKRKNNIPENEWGIVLSWLARESVYNNEEKSQDRNYRCLRVNKDNYKVVAMSSLDY